MGKRGESDADKLRRERERIENRRRVEADHRARFGPLSVTGPDGVGVRLEVRTTGQAEFSGLAALAPEPWYLRQQRYVTPGDRLRYFARPGFELAITAPGLQWRLRRHRTDNEDAAAAMLAEAKKAVQSGGLGMLRWWATHQPRR